MADPAYLPYQAAKMVSTAGLLHLKIVPEFNNSDEVTMEILRFIVVHHGNSWGYPGVM